jgi:hypothetical protein
MTEPEKPRTITAAEIAREIGVGVRWVVRHADELPFTRRLNRKLIIYDRAGFEKWWATQCPMNKA